MSLEAPTWYTTQYNNRVINIYQTKGNRLRPTVTAAGRIENDKAIFWKAGTGKARKKLRGQRAVPMNTGRSKIEVNLETWEAFDTVEEFDLDRMQVNEREVVARQGANALGRATDEEIMAGMDAVAPTSTDNNFVDGGSNGFSPTYALTMCQRLQTAKAPWDGEVYCGLPPLFWNQFIAYKVVNSSDHVGPGNLPFVQATDTRFWNGVNWFLAVEEESEAWFPIPSSNKLDIFMWHRSAVGWANNTDLRSIWQWDNYESWWTVNMQTKGTDVILQSTGIIRGRFATNTSIPTLE